jgi:transposase
LGGIILYQEMAPVWFRAESFPICCELWPGNTADITTLLPIVNRLKTRFAIQDFCIVADRGMISKETADLLEENGIFYILGARMRRNKEVKYQVLTRAGRYQEIYPEMDEADAPSPLKVKEVWVDEHRYIVCLNEKQARKDKADREAILESLREKLTEGPKQLVGNKGYRKYLSAVKDSWKIDEGKIIEEQRYDGKWVLQTNTNYTAEDVALLYKELWMVEQAFKTSKTTFSTRPIYHQNDNQIRGHVFCSFLALVLKKMLYGKLAEKGLDYEWEKIKLDLSELRYITVQKGEEKVLLRTECRGTCSGVFFASGVAVPPAFQKLTPVSN